MLVLCTLELIYLSMTTLIITLEYYLILDSSSDFLLLIIGLFIKVEFNRILLFLEYICLENNLENLDHS